MGSSAANKKSSKKSSDSKSGSSSKKTVTVKTEINSDVAGLIYITTGIVLAIAVYTNFAGILSVTSQKILSACIGIGKYIAPVYIIYFGFMYIKNKGKITFSKNFFGITTAIIIVMLLCTTIFLQASNDPDDFSQNLKEILQGNSVFFHGGMLSYFICYPLCRFVGFLGTYIILSAFSLAAIIIFFEINLADIVSKSAIINRSSIKITTSSQDNKKPEKKKKKKKKSFVNIIDRTDDDEEALDETKVKIIDFMKGIDSGTEETEPQIEKKQPVINLKDERTEKNYTDYKNKKSNKKEENSIDEEIKIQLEKQMEKKEYICPSAELLESNVNTKLNNDDKKELLESANKLEEILSDFGVEAQVIEVTKGPSVTRFELQPRPGVKVSKIVNLSDDIALGLAASGIRIEAPIPGKAAVGIEVPNAKQTAVFLREVLEDPGFVNTNKKIAFALGKDISGKCVIGDLSSMPHVLIAGATGSGKSVCINSLIISILYKYTPDEVKLLMVDPKVVELSVYNDIPHLLIPVVTEPKKAAGALSWAVNEMNNRYKLFAETSVRNIKSYNELYDKGLIENKLPYIVIIVDELADLMMVCPNDVEDYIGRLAQMARAAGMHLVIATQRPSVDVITGVIKANIPSRISFAVSSQIDSRTILDSSGAEKLLGRGDMLYAPIGEGKPIRVQGCFISEEDVEKVVSFIKAQEGQNLSYSKEIIDHINSAEEIKSTSGKDARSDEDILEEAIDLVIEKQQASTLLLQKELKLGYRRALRIMEQLEENKIISGKDGNKARKVLISKGEMTKEDSKKDS